MRVVHEIGQEFGDAARAKLHQRYVDKFVADALVLGLEPESPDFVRYVVGWLADLNFDDGELRRFCSARGYDFDAMFARPSQQSH